MTNPNNAVGTNAAYAGRTSVNAFNDGLASYTRGVMSGWACVPSSGLTVSLGGSGSTRDVAVAEDNAGNKTSINNISGSPINVTMSAAPGANSRIDAIVAYVDNPPQGSATVADNYQACGLIAVSGTAAADPVAPSDSVIRSAITSDGASGTTAYYVVLAYITMTSGTTDITADQIQSGGNAAIGEDNLDFATLGFGNYSTTEVSTGFTWINGSTIYKTTVHISAFPNNTERQYAHGISNINQIVRTDGFMNAGSNGAVYPLGTPPNPQAAVSSGIMYYVNRTYIIIRTGSDRSSYDGYITLYYTKS